jgi:hypothetical protein
MILCCSRCDEPLGPELPGLVEFHGVALCRACLKETPECSLGQSGEPAALCPPLVVVDIEGQQLDILDIGGQDPVEALADVDRFRAELLEAFREQLPTFQDAYLSLGRAGREAFRQYLVAVVALHGHEQSGACGNPYCIFRVVLECCRLIPAEIGSPYAGHYVGNHPEEVSFPKALLAALRCWEEGRDFEIDGLADLEQYE